MPCELRSDDNDNNDDHNDYDDHNDNHDNDYDDHNDNHDNDHDDHDRSAYQLYKLRRLQQQCDWLGSDGRRWGGIQRDLHIPRLLRPMPMELGIRAEHYLNAQYRNRELDSDGD